MQAFRAPRALCLAALWMIAVAVPRVALGQVNIESLRKDLKDAPATANVSASFTGRSGNTESVETGASAFGAARVDPHTFLASAQADYGKFNGATTVSKTFIHFRYNYRFLPWLIGEAFAQQQQDKFQRLLLRELVGTGPRFLLLDEPELRVAHGIAYMFEYERISVPPGASDDPIEIAHRLSTYLSVLWQPDSRVRTVATAYFQPRIDDPSDFRVLLEATVETQITKRVSIKVVGTLRSDSEPPTSVKPLDLEIKNAFALKF